MPNFVNGRTDGRVSSRPSGRIIIYSASRFSDKCFTLRSITTGHLRCGAASRPLAEILAEGSGNDFPRSRPSQTLHGQPLVNRRPRDSQASATLTLGYERGISAVPRDRRRRFRDFPKSRSFRGVASARDRGHAKQHSPGPTRARLKDFVRNGASLIILDDGRIGERGSARPERHAAAARESRRRHGAIQCSRRRRTRRPEGVREGPGRGKGTSLNRASLAPKLVASSVYVRVPEAPCPHRFLTVVRRFLP